MQLWATNVCTTHLLASAHTGSARRQTLHHKRMKRTDPTLMQNAEDEAPNEDIAQLDGSSISFHSPVKHQSLQGTLYVGGAAARKLWA